MVAAEPAAPTAPTATERVYDALYAAVLEHRLVPGARLREEELAERFAVSRTVVRQALQRLAQNRLVELQHNRGAQVAEPSRELAAHVFDARRVVECEVARRLGGRLPAGVHDELAVLLDEERAAHARGDRPAAIRLSGQFHRRLAELSGNPVFLNLLDELLPTTSLLMVLDRGGTRALCVHHRHQELLAALAASGPAAAAEMRRHLCEIEKTLTQAPHDAFAAYREPGCTAGRPADLESRPMPHATPDLPPMQLTLFDEAPPPRQAAAVPPPPVQPPAVEATPRAAAPSTEFRHPRSQRELLLSGHRVAYELRRSRRRTIGFVVGAEGLSVSAPRWVGMAEIESALREKGSWILRKLHEQRERSARLEAARVEWREGGTVPFLGDTVILVLDPRTTGAVLHTDATALPGVPRLTLHLGLPQTAEPDQIRDVVQSWLQRQARRVFEERCALFADRLGVRMKRLSLSSASTRWGSASADGSIRLNWRLVHFAVPVIDYVVTHELAHLREMNHGPAFWDVVRQALPGFEEARGALRHEVLPVLD